MKNLEKIAVVIDADHIQACSISDVLCEISTYGRITVKRAYGDWRKESLNNWENELRRLAIKAEQQFDERSAGMALAIDTMELLCSHMYDAFAIVTSDSDYAPLAIKLRESGAYVIGVGDQKVTESFRGACDEFLCLENLSAGTNDGISTEEDIVEGSNTPPESSNMDDNSFTDHLSSLRRPLLNGNILNYGCKKNNGPGLLYSR